MKLFEGKKQFIELALVVFILLLALALYLTLSGNGQKGARVRYKADDELTEGLNHYRLENYERASFILREAEETARTKKVKSLAALYLGNISYKQGRFSDSLVEYTRAIALDGKSPHALYNAALSVLKTGNPQKSLEYAVKAFQVDDGFAPSALLAGNICFAMERYEQALYYYGRGDAAGGVAKYNRAVVLLTIGERKRAEALLEELSGDSIAGPLVRGLSHAALAVIRQETDKRKTLENLRKAVELFPSSPVLRYDLSLLLMKEGMFPEALFHLNDLAMKPDEYSGAFEGGAPKVGVLRGIALFKTGRYREALDLYLSIYGENAQAETASVIGDIYVKMGEREKAKAAYERSIAGGKGRGAGKSGSPTRGAYLNLVTILIAERKYEEALSASDAFLRRFPDDPFPYICKAQIYFAMRSPVEAAKALERAATAAKEDLNSLLRIATLYRDNGFYNNALQLYHRILSRDPNSRGSLAGLAMTYARSGHLEKTIQAISKARASTADPDVFYELSLALASNLDSTKAILLYEELIRGFPYRYEAFHNLALLAIRRGEYEQARKTVQSCLLKNPTLRKETKSDLFVILGVSEEGLGGLDEAFDSFARARELNGRSSIPLSHLRRIEKLKKAL